MKAIPKIIWLSVVAAALASLTVRAAPGDLFVAVHNSGTIYKFAPDGTQSTFATGLVGPTGVAFDNAGNLFAADSLSSTIYKFAPDGTRSTFASGLNFPIGLAFDSAGNLFAADYVSGNIYKFTSDGTRSTFGDAAVGPQGLAFDSAGNLFVAVYNSGTIYEFAPDGTRSTFATSLQYSPVGLAFDSGGNLFVSANTIYKYTPGGVQSTFATFDPPANDPQGLAFDSAGNLFVAVYTANTIYKFLPDGTRSTFATGGLNGPLFLAIQPAPAISYAAQIQQPINSDGTSVFNVRRGVVPVKFTLTQGGVPTCALPPATIAVTRTAGGTTGSIDESIYSGSADTGSNFRINSCQYVYNLSANAFGVGTYRVDILINGQVVGSGIFQLK